MFSVLVFFLAEKFTWKFTTVVISPFIGFPRSVYGRFTVHKKKEKTKFLLRSSTKTKNKNRTRTTTITYGNILDNAILCMVGGMAADEILDAES